MPSLFRQIVSRMAALTAPLASSRSDGGWFGVVREPYTGAWQKNDELRPDTVLSNPTVFRCVSLITTDISKTPLRLVAVDDEGIWQETTNPAFSPVLRRPNRYQTIGPFLESWTTSKLLHGNTYVLKERDARGVVKALYVLDPQKVTPLIAPDGAVYYELQRDDLAGISDEATRRGFVVPASEIIHDRWNCLFHPLVGISPLYACSGAALQALTIQDNSTAFFANGSRPSGIILMPGAPSDDVLRSLKDEWAAARTGMNRGGTGWLSHGMTYQPLTQNAVDSQMTEQLRWSANTIAGVFGVPISMVDSSQQPPYANSEASALQYRSQCLQTLMTSIENCLDDGLELPTPYGTEFDVDFLIWMDTATKTKAAHDAIGAGAMTPNEARNNYFGLPSVPGGDTPYMQQQYRSLAEVARQTAAAPAAPAVPDPFAEEAPV